MVMPLCPMGHCASKLHKSLEAGNAKNDSNAFALSRNS